MVPRSHRGWPQTGPQGTDQAGEVQIPFSPHAVLSGVKNMKVVVGDMQLCNPVVCAVCASVSRAGKEGIGT